MSRTPPWGHFNPPSGYAMCARPWPHDGPCAHPLEPVNDTSPEQVVLDVVLRWSDAMPRMGEATVKAGQLILVTRNHLGQPVSLCVPLHNDRLPRTGDDPSFALLVIHPGVLKLTPSVKHPMLHAYVTVVGAPDAVGT